MRLAQLDYIAQLKTNRHQLGSPPSVYPALAPMAHAPTPFIVPVMMGGQEELKSQSPEGDHSHSAED